MRTGATFRVKGVESGRVSAILGLEPSVADSEVWRLQVDPADGVELDSPLTELLDTLDGVRNGLDDLVRQGASFDFFCYLGSAADEHAAALSPVLLRRIADLPAELLLDVYQDRP